MDSKEVKRWGGRFEGSVTDAVKKFTESISFDKDLYNHEIMGSRAHASMLARQGLISEDAKNSILKGLDELEGQIEKGEFVWTTDGEDVHMNIEAAATDLVAEPEKKLHTARSTNDQDWTLVHPWVGDAIQNVVMCLMNLQAALVKLALKDEGLRLIVPGYTHLQRAHPVLPHNHFLAYVKQLARDAYRLLVCQVRMNFFPLGACALAGTDLPIGRLMNSEALGFIAPMRNRPNKENDEGSDNDKGSNRGNGRWIRTLAGAGLVIGGVVCLYLVYKTGQAIEKEIVGAVRDWKNAGFPALVNIQVEKVGLKFSIY